MCAVAKVGCPIRTNSFPPCQRAQHEFFRQDAPFFVKLPGTLQASLHLMFSFFEDYDDRNLGLWQKSFLLVRVLTISRRLLTYWVLLSLEQELLWQHVTLSVIYTKCNFIGGVVVCARKCKIRQALFKFRRVWFVHVLLLRFLMFGIQAQTGQNLVMHGWGEELQRFPTFPGEYYRTSQWSY